MATTPSAKKSLGAKKAPAKKAIVKKAPAKKAPAKKAPAKKAPAKKAPAKKAIVKKAPAKKAPAKKAIVKKAPAKKAPAKKAPAKKAPAKKAPAKKAPAKKAPAKKAIVKKAPAKAAPVAKAPVVKKPAAPVAPKISPYAKDEKFIAKIKLIIAELKQEKEIQKKWLIAEAEEIVAEDSSGPREVQFDDESGEGANAAVDRERDLALASKLQEEIDELNDALRRIRVKRYGLCEKCFKPIPKARLEAMPFAHVDVTCATPSLSRF